MLLQFFCIRQSKSLITQVWKLRNDAIKKGSSLKNITQQANIWHQTSARGRICGHSSYGI